MTAALAILLVLLTEAGVVLTHVWAREDHTHPAHRPWIRGLPIANTFHLASFCSHWPSVLGLLYLAGVPEWAWIGTGVASAVIWAVVKRVTGKRWPFWWVQTWRWIGKRG